MTISKDHQLAKLLPDLSCFESKESDHPIRYPVMARKTGAHWTSFDLGFVVTHLDLKTWCQWKGYDFDSLVIYPGTRGAFPGEATDLR